MQLVLVSYLFGNYCPQCEEKKHFFSFIAVHKLTTKQQSKTVELIQDKHQEQNINKQPLKDTPFKRWVQKRRNILIKFHLNYILYTFLMPFYFVIATSFG